MMTNALWYMAGLLTVPVLVMAFLVADRITASTDEWQRRRRGRKMRQHG